MRGGSMHQMGTLVAAMALLAGACAGDTAARPGTGEAVAAVTPSVAPTPVVAATPTPDPADEWDIGVATVLDVVPVEGVAADASTYGYRADGDSIHLVAVTADGSELVRIDRASGSVAARRPLEQPAAPYDRASIELTAAGLLLAEGDRSRIQLLDDTLATVAEIDAPPDSRTDLEQSSHTATEIWISHTGYDEDLRSGQTTFSGLSRATLEPFRLVSRTAVAGLGLEGAVGLDDDSTAVALASLYQLGVVDDDGAVQRLLPSFPIAARLRALDDGLILASWARLGYLARWDPTTDEVITLDVTADGPTLVTVSEPYPVGDSVWLYATVADPALPDLAIRVDPAAMTVTARAWLPHGVRLINSGGLVTLGLDGTLSAGRLDPDSVVGEAPATVVRPERPSFEAITPTGEDEAAVVTALERALDPTVTGAAVAEVLEHADLIAEPRQRLADLAAVAFPGVAPTVTSLSVAGVRAELVYVFLLDGVPVAFPLTAGLDRGRDGKWRLRAESLCRLAGELQIDCPELPGP